MALFLILNESQGRHQPIRTFFELWNILNKGGLIEGELNYIEIYLSYISKTIDESFPNPHLIITEHPDKWLGTDVPQTRPPRPDGPIRTVWSEQ